MRAEGWRGWTHAVTEVTWWRRWRRFLRWRCAKNKKNVNVGEKKWPNERKKYLKIKLTFYADDFGPVPLAVGATLGGRHVALKEAVGALVASHRVDVVVGAFPTNQEGVVHGGRGSAKHCGGRGKTGHLFMGSAPFKTFKCPMMLSAFSTLSQPLTAHTSACGLRGGQSGRVW